MITYLDALLLGLVQGVTEWLPVSSSAHLALLQELLGISPPVLFDIALHFGTLLAVVAYMRNDIIALLRRRDLLAYIVLASIPTAIIGFALHDFFASFFSNIALVGAALIVTGIALYCTRFAKEKTRLAPASALVIGVAQGISVAPGISRSGSTIATGMLLGINREEAARFSFLLSIPAIAGAALFEARHAAFAIPDPGPTLLGVAIAALVGYASIDFLLKFLKKGDLGVFSWYCWLLGAGAVIWGIFL
jgi:undecaprenyl-diphosphatase